MKTSALRSGPLPYKPRIYLHRYASGLTFWRVRKPLIWNGSTKPNVKAAYNTVNLLNRQREDENAN